MKKVACFILASLVAGYLFDRARTRTKIAIIGGAAATGYGLWKLVEAANKPSEDAAYRGIDDDPRYW